MADFTGKSERLSSAVYLITSFFSDQEPIKWKLRTLSSDLISLSIIVKDNLSKDREVVNLKIRNILLETISLLSIVRNVGLVSDTNYSLLHGEFLKYIDLLNIPIGLLNKDNNLALTTDFFNVDSQNDKTPEYTGKTLLIDKNDEVLQERNSQELANRATNIDKGHLSRLSSHDIDIVRNTGNLKDFGVVSVKKNSRQSIIVAILKRKKEIMIKDISPLISGCSEKTIQRELSEMVRAGVLKKVGEKRWSRYSLA